MRNLRTNLVTLAFAGTIAGGVAFGCSADGSANIAGDNTNTDTNGTVPAPSDTSAAPAAPASTGSSSNGGGSGGSGGGGGGGVATDAGSAPVDAGPPAPAVGDSCATLNAIFTRSCGFCGSQQAVCLAGGDGGGGKVSDYSTCTGEVANGCTPGTSATEACGLCGTHQKICQNNCQWAAGSCTGEPVGACTPGVVTNTGAGCSAGSYRQQTCGNDCKLGNVSVSCGPFMNPVTLQVPAAVNGVVSHTQDLEIVAGQTFSLSTGTCPSSTVKADYPTDYVEVDNNTGKTAKLTIYQSATPGGTELDTVLFIYNGSAPPTTDPTKLACTGSIADSCSSTALCGSMSTFTFASQTGVTVAPGGKILVYSGGYFNDVTGPMMINVRTDSLN